MDSTTSTEYDGCKWFLPEPYHSTIHTTRQQLKNDLANNNNQVDRNNKWEIMERFELPNDLSFIGFDQFNILI